MPVCFSTEARVRGIRMKMGDLGAADAQHRAEQAETAGLYMICTLSKHMRRSKVTTAL